jgi:hypothetical protein
MNAIEPVQLGFVCSERHWKLYTKRQLLLGTAQQQSDEFPPNTTQRHI